MSLAEQNLGADTTQQAEAEGRWSELLQPRHLAATVTLCLGVALFAFNEFFVSTALPTAVEEFGGAALLSWAFTLYLVFAIVGGAMAANLKTGFGARKTLIAAALVFATGTVIATTASGMPQVLAGRLLQGFGEGISRGRLLRTHSGALPPRSCQGLWRGKRSSGLPPPLPARSSRAAQRNIGRGAQRSSSDIPAVRSSSRLSWRSFVNRREAQKWR